MTEPNYSRELPRTRECARLAREFLQESVPNSPALDSLGLIASELVTNAFLHGVGPIEISLTLGSASGAELRVSSGYDLSAGEPNLIVQRDSKKLAERGRGLQIVNGLCSRWGWETKGSTLIVWAEVAG